MKIRDKHSMLQDKSNLLYLIFIVAISMYGSLMAYRGYMNYQGYCWKEQRYLTSQEKMKRAVNDLLANYPPAVIPKQDFEDKSGEVVERIIPIEEFKNGVQFRSWSLSPPHAPVLYSSVIDFFERNPDCCELRRYPSFIDPIEFEVPSFFELIFDKESSYVRFRYWVKYKEDGVEKKIQTSYYAGLSNCGEIAWANTIPRFVENMR